MLKNTFKRFLFLVIDVIIFIVSVVLTFSVRNFADIDISYSSIVSQVTIFYPIIVILIISLFVSEMYDVPVIYSKVARVYRIVYSHLATGVISIFIFYILENHFIGSPKTLLLIFTFINIFLLSLWRVYGSKFLRNSQRLQALLIGSGNEINDLRDQVNRHDSYPFYFIDHLSVVDRDIKEGRLFHDEKPEEVIKTLKNILEKNNIENIVLDIRNPEVLPLLPYLYNLTSQNIKLYDMSLMYQDVFRKLPLSAIGYFWFFEHVTLDKKIYDFLKRFIDILLSIPVLIIFIICIPFVYLANKIEGSGDGKLFSIQKRLGAGGKIINIYKFRTMLYTDEGKWRRESDNPNRPTKVGIFLNRSNIDELPQVINILKNHMSFVGPRNDIVALGERLYREIPYYMIRYSVKPGITGWAQISQRVKGQNPQSVEENIIRFQYDLFYVKNRSLLIDLIIILRTVKALLSRFF